MYYTLWFNDELCRNSILLPRNNAVNECRGLRARILNPKSQYEDFFHDPDLKITDSTSRIFIRAGHTEFPKLENCFG